MMMMYRLVVNGDVYTSIVAKHVYKLSHDNHTIMKDNLAFEMPRHSYQL